MLHIMEMMLIQPKSWSKFLFWDIQHRASHHVIHKTKSKSNHKTSSYYQQSEQSFITVRVVKIMGRCLPTTEAFNVLNAYLLMNGLS
jgi:hypothetical protein